MSQFRRLSSQRGTSIFGLVVIAIVVGFIMLMGTRIFPVVNEYLTIKRGVSQIMRNNPGSAADVRAAFQRTTDVEYSIHTVKPEDLHIEQLSNGALRTSFAYNVEIPLVEPVFLLIKFEGSATSGGASSGP